MKKADYQFQLRLIFDLATQARLLKIQDVLRAIEGVEVFAPIISPTLYRKAALNLQWQTEVVEAALQFQRTLEEIASDPKYQPPGE